MGCSPWGHDWATSFHFSLSHIGEGNGNPLQCSFLENPRDGGAWWAAVYGVAQSRTRLKWLSSSSSSIIVLVVQSLSCVWLFATPWTAAHQASLSFTISCSLLKLTSIELMIPSNHLVLCCPLLFLLSNFPRIRVFSKESALHIMWPKYWSFSFSISLPMNIQDWFPLGLTDLIFLKSSPVPQFKNINSSALSLKN